MRKDPDALKNWSPESNQQIAETQRELIDSAFHALRPGGTLVYSTCTLNREENQEVVQWLLARYPQAVEILPLGALFPQATEALTAEGFLHVFPQIFDCEGFLLPASRKPRRSKRYRRRVTKSVNFLLRRLKAAKPQRLPPPLPPSGCTGMTVIRSGSVIKRFGCFRKRWNHLSARSFSRIGIRLAETHNKGFRWQHEAVIALAAPDAPFELTQDEAQEWYRGRDVYPETPPRQDEVIVTFQEQRWGWRKSRLPFEKQLPA